MKQQSIVAQVSALERLSIEELRAKWEALFDASPPNSSNRKQLIARLAYRIQELAYGGLSRAARERLETLAATDPAGAGNASSSARDPNLPVPGTKLVREWQGRRIEATVLEKGFECEGKRYRSLSAIATTITGTKWNGWDFFGMRQRGKGETNGR